MSHSATNQTNEDPDRNRSHEEMLIVMSKTKDVLRSQGVYIASDALIGLNWLVHWHIQQGAKRAKLNGRKTVHSHDFLAI